MKTPDFSGYATKAGLKCSDGRTIMPEAFKHMDGMTVPLVWQHGHSDPANVLGHAVLEAREDGVYAYGYFNGSQSAGNAKQLVQHEDITALSIYANQLIEKAKSVFHGVIREVSLVLSGANPGAFIDNVSIAHGDGSTDILNDEAVIYTGLELSHSDDEVDEDDSDEDDSDEDFEHGADDTVQDIYDELSPEQKNVVHYMIGKALEASGAKKMQQSDDDDENLAHEEGQDTMNVFEKNGKSTGTERHTLSHDAIKGIVADAERQGSLKAAVESYAIEHGIDNIDILFPDAKALDATPEWIKRRTEWVAGVLNGVRPTPFSRIKTRTADLTFEDARAKGYIKGSLKKEEFFGVAQRTTGPTTIYKKQKLDRDDMIDITDFDVVAWLKGEMRLMLEEEMARAILIGDGRLVDDEDKIKDPSGATDGMGIRAIANDHELYVTTVNVNITEDKDYNLVVEDVMRARRFYKGSGSPTFYTTNPTMVEMLLSKDTFGRRRWNTKEELASALMVSSIVEVESMEGEENMLGIIVNLADYAVGADKGGEVNMFDDFDIDYNQHKYLIESRVSGALTKVKSALKIMLTAVANVLARPAAPVYDDEAETVTIVDTTGVEYYNSDGNTAMNAAGSPYSVPVDGVIDIYATPASGYYFGTDAEDQWTFTYTA
jgi:hypothetical protein